MQNPSEMPPFVAFEKRPVEDRSILISAGKYGYKNINIAKITRPGQRDTVEKEAEVWLKDLEKRCIDGLAPANWHAHFADKFEKWLAGQEIPLEGTPIAGWPLANPAEVRTLQAIGFQTVEQLAAASDEAVQKIGMGGVALKQRAKTFLEAAEKGAPAAQLAALQQENAALKESLQKLLGEMQSLKASLQKAA